MNTAALVIFSDCIPMTGLIHIESQFETSSSLVFGFHGEKPLSNVPDKTQNIPAIEAGTRLGTVGVGAMSAMDNGIKAPEMAGSLELNDLWGPFRHKPFYDSMKWCQANVIDIVVCQALFLKGEARKSRGWAGVKMCYMFHQMHKQPSCKW